MTYSRPRETLESCFIGLSHQGHVLLVENIWEYDECYNFNTGAVYITGDLPSNL